MQITVENIKCSGCANTITKKLTDECAATNISIDIETGTISLDVENTDATKVAQVLKKIGYPEVGDNSLASKAKSFASCAVGRMTHED